MKLLTFLFMALLAATVALNYFGAPDWTWYTTTTLAVSVVIKGLYDVRSQK